MTPEATPLDACSPECVALLERVINSRELKRALRLRELLEYVGKQSQQSPAHTIREQEIGAAVFGRPEDYDTSLDNIVRVNVSELRKRLAHYFQEEGAAEPIVIEIPRGGYLPVFLARSVGREDSVPAMAMPVPVFEPEPAERATAVPASSAAIVVAQAPRRHRGALLGLAIAVLLGCGLLIWQNHRLAVELQPWKEDPLVASFWTNFFASGDEVDIVTADTSFAMAEDLLGQTISLDDYLDYKYKDIPNQTGLSPDRKLALEVILGRNNGSIGDFQAAKRFMDLDAFSPALKLASARSYTPENIKANNVILIGGRQSNPWVDLYKDRMNFFMEYEPGIQRSYVVNRNPQAGEKPTYEVVQDKNRSYSVVAFLPNFRDRSYVLILSGTDSQATRAAGEFVTSPEGLAQIRQKMPTGRFPLFELVLSSSRLSGTTLRTEIVASRLHER
jgi:hypothetical protein